MSTLQQEGLKTLVNNINKDINTKINAIKVDAYSKSEVDSFVQPIQDEYIDTLFEGNGDGSGGGEVIPPQPPVDLSNYYNKQEADAKFPTKTEISDSHYNKQESDTKYATKQSVTDLTSEVNTVKTDAATINSTVESLKSSVSNGKGLVASAITDKGVSTSNDATFETMANNIKNISGAFECRPGNKYKIASLFPIDANGQFLAYEGTATYKGGIRFDAVFADYKERNRTVYINVIIPNRNIDQRVKKSGSDYMLTCTYDTPLVLQPGDFIRILAGYETSITVDTGMACTISLSCDY